MWWSKKGNKGRQGQAVAKSASGVPFNTDLDSARGPAPEDVEAPKEVIIRPEPDHAPAGQYPLHICNQFVADWFT